MVIRILFTEFVFNFLILFGLDSINDIRISLKRHHYSMHYLDSITLEARNGLRISLKRHHYSMQLLRDLLLIAYALVIV